MTTAGDVTHVTEETARESEPPPPPLIDPALTARAVATWEQQGRPTVVIARNEKGQPYRTTDDLERFLAHPGACCEADRYAAIRDLLGEGAAS
jgi:hypothetical protein